MFNVRVLIGSVLVGLQIVESDGTASFCRSFDAVLPFVFELDLAPHLLKMFHSLPVSLSLSFKSRLFLLLQLLRLSVSVELLCVSLPSRI